MPKLHIKRFYYRNGRIHTESREVESKFHGLYRTWHRTGQLAEELRYRHGLMHGVNREWDENGRLLGSFTMVNGTGLQRYWHDNGRLKMEISSLNGKFHGRCRDWLRDGTLFREDYLINNQDVTRATYLKAARKNPSWPQYEGEPAGQVARPGLALERKKHDLFIQSIFEKPHHAEARAWLNAEPHPKSRSLAKFATTKAALKFVEQLYAAGADAVIIAAIYAGQRKKLFADWFLLQLPASKSKRNSLRKICQTFCRKRGGAVLPDKDIGETHLLMMLHV
jgi:MORN repeat protein